MRLEWKRSYLVIWIHGWVVHLWSSGHGEWHDWSLEPGQRL